MVSGQGLMGSHDYNGELMTNVIARGHRLSRGVMVQVEIEGRNGQRVAF